MTQPRFTRTCPKRTARLLCALIGLALLASSTPGPGRVSAQALEDFPLDLAAMTLTPADLAAEGLDGFYALGGSTLEWDGLAREIDPWDDQNTQEALHEMIESTAGIPTGYQIDLRAGFDPDDPESGTARDINVSLFGFRDDADAGAAFDLIADVIEATGLVTPAEADQTFADDSVRFRVDESDSGPDVLVFHTERVLAIVEVFEYAPEDDAEIALEPLSPADVDALVTRLIAKIETGLDGETPGLGARTLRLADDEFRSLYELRGDGYWRIAGDEIIIGREPSESAEARSAAAGDATDAYELVQFLQIDPTEDIDLPDRVGFENRLYRFEDEAAATAWLDDHVALLENGDNGLGGDVEELEGVDDFPSLGDQSAAFSYLSSQGGNAPSREVRALLRLGDTVADTLISVGNPEEPPIQAIIGLATVQAHCLGTAGCPVPSPISDALAGRAPDAAAPSSNDLALDLPAITLTPADLEDVGLDGFGANYGAMTFADAEIASAAERLEIDEDEVAEVLEESGFQRRYDSYLYLPEENGDPGSPAEMLVASYVLEFADADGAEAAFAFLEDESADPASEDVDLSTDLGDDAEATIAEGEDPDTGDPLLQVDITVLTGNLHVGVALVTWTGDEPDQDVAEELAARLLDRVEEAEESEAPALGNQILRLTGDGIETTTDGYTIRAGEAIPRYGERTRDTRTRTRAAENIDQTDGYALAQLLLPGESGPEEDIWYQAEALHFSDEDAAEDWLANTEDRIEDNSAVADYDILTDAPTYGDESITYITTIETDAGDVEFHSVTIRVDATIVLIDMSGPDAPSAAAVESIAAAQAECLEAGGCTEPMVVPDELLLGG
jgi:hypothetical protein